MVPITSFEELNRAIARYDLSNYDLIPIFQDLIGMERAKIEALKLLGDDEQRFLAEITLCNSMVFLSFLRLQNDIAA